MFKTNKLSYLFAFRKRKQHEQNCFRGEREVFLNIKQQSNHSTIESSSAKLSIILLVFFSSLCEALVQLMLMSLYNQTYFQQQALWPLHSCAITTRFSSTNRWGTRAWSGGRKLHTFQLGKFRVLFRSSLFPPLLIFIFYYFKSFAWVVATLFGITGYATFTTLSQGICSFT